MWTCASAEPLDNGRKIYLIDIFPVTEVCRWGKKQSFVTLSMSRDTPRNDSVLNGNGCVCIAVEWHLWVLQAGVLGCYNYLKLFMACDAAITWKWRLIAGVSIGNMGEGAWSWIKGSFYCLAEQAGPQAPCTTGCFVCSNPSLLSPC